MAGSLDRADGIELFDFVVVDDFGSEITAHEFLAVDGWVAGRETAFAAVEFGALIGVVIEVFREICFEVVKDYAFFGLIEARQYGVG